MALRNCFLTRKLSAFFSPSEEELGILDGLHRNRRSFLPGSHLIQEGQSDHTVFVLTEGWTSSYKTLRDGRRQIVDFQIPGDFLGLRSLLFRTADCGIESITPVRAWVIKSKNLHDTFEKFPHIATAVLWSTLCDEAIVVERLVSLGRRDAAERMAHFFLELGERLRLVGLGTETGFACPLSQHHLADTLGFSAVHVNRVLRQLREQGLLTFRNGNVMFDNFDGLAAFAGFDAAYLNHVRPVIRESILPKSL